MSSKEKKPDLKTAGKGSPNPQGAPEPATWKSVDDLIEVTGTPLYDKEGQLVSITLIGTDNTEDPATTAPTVPPVLNAKLDGTEVVFEPTEEFSISGSVTLRFLEGDRKEVTLVARLDYDSETPHVAEGGILQFDKQLAAPAD